MTPRIARPTFSTEQIMEVAEATIARAVSVPLGAVFIISDQPDLTVEEKTELLMAVQQLIAQATITVSWPNRPGRRTVIEPEPEGGTTRNEAE